MSDLATSFDAPLSTTIDTDPGASASGAGMPTKLPEDDKPLSVRDTIASVIQEPAKEAKPETAKEPKEQAKEPEPKEEPKSDKARDPAGKFAAQEPKQDKLEQPKEERKAWKDLTEEERTERLATMTPEQRDRLEKGQTPAPEKFLPKAKELWVSVPNEVKAEVARLHKEHETEINQYREAFQPLAKYHHMARESGTHLHEALDRYTNMETTLRQNPAEGFKALLSNMEMQPATAIGHILKAFGVNPQALANHIAQDPGYYTPRDVPQQPHQDPRVSELEGQLHQERSERLRESVIEPFKASHPRYAELQTHIANLLNSGMVPDSLNPVERLETAYDMAVRLNPVASNDAISSDPDEEAPERLAAPSSNGTKSIKSAPGAVSDDLEPDSGGSIRDVLEDVVRKQLRRS